MKDSQQGYASVFGNVKYIKANNERFSTGVLDHLNRTVSISRRIMKDSQPQAHAMERGHKYIKANNERFSTDDREDSATD